MIITINYLIINNYYYARSYVLIVLYHGY